ncbi:tyrosine-type recombinase/integrase [Pedobacter deserti]|uniref:tyrosine-type recombinase/integrase n=1 Tax=Pedobacter deserti TaxID=2817382 RepID=UPI002109CEBE|nr:tyrosine-type recombinase/integrase [Pedobacter sp. SYSU D00382]
MNMLVDHFLKFLQHEKRYSANTIGAYQNDLGQFAGFLTSEFELEVGLAQPVHVRAYVAWLMENGVAESSVNRKVSTLRSFYKYQVRQGEMKVSPVRQIRTPKVPARVPVFVDDQKMNTLLDSEDIFDKSFSSVRDRMILEVLFGTGIRVSELLALKEQDVDKYNCSITVTGKRNKQRVVPLTKLLSDELRDFIVLKSIHEFSTNADALFVTNKGLPMSRGQVYGIVRRYLTYISTQKKKGPHVLRHSYATSLLNRGADLNAIKELLGHESLAATQVYTHNTIERLKSIYKLAHPKA